MPKRSKRDTLTGGTKDVNPQWFPMLSQQSAPDATTTTQFPIPIQRLKQDSDRSQVMEILKVSWDIPQVNALASTGFFFEAAISTVNPGATLASPATTLSVNQFNARGNTVDYIARTILGPLGVTSADISQDDPVIHDLTDGDGHGILVATDFIYLTMITQLVGLTATGTAQQMLAKVLYRWKEVSLQEYIGIVQSQQT